jgi:hypothetical protein
LSFFCLKNSDAVLLSAGNESDFLAPGSKTRQTMLEVLQLIEEGDANSTASTYQAKSVDEGSDAAGDAAESNLDGGGGGGGGGGEQQAQQTNTAAVAVAGVGAAAESNLGGSGGGGGGYGGKQHAQQTNTGAGAGTGAGARAGAGAGAGAGDFVCLNQGVSFGCRSMAMEAKIGTMAMEAKMAIDDADRSDAGGGQDGDGNDSGPPLCRERFLTWRRSGC